MQVKANVAEIDGLRAVAVLAVLVYHLDPALLPGGFTGVDVFLVISGYVVTRSLLSHAESDRAGSWPGQLAGFLARRLRRIVPALLVALLATMVLTAAFIPEGYLSAKAENTGRAAFWGLGNLVLALDGEAYFAPRTEYNPFTHTWSLGVEEQFYLVLPVFVLLLAGAAVRHERLPKLPVLALAATCALSFGLAWHWGGSRSEWAFYLLPTRFWELGAGVLLCLVQWGRPDRSPAYRTDPRPAFPISPRLLFAVGLALVIAGLVRSDIARFPFPWALLPVTGSLLLIHSVTSGSGPGRIAAALRWRPVVFVGLISYSLYLWHWPVIVLLRWTVGIGSTAPMLVAAALSLALAVLSWRFVERPFRTGWPGLGAGRVAGLGLGAILAGSLLAEAVLRWRPELSLSVTREREVWQSLGDLAGVPTQGTMHGRRMFVIGNSHAGAYARMLAEAERDLGLDVILLTDRTCRIGEVMRPPDTGPACRALRESFLAQIDAEGRPGDIVFFASLRMPRISYVHAPLRHDEVLAETRSPEFAQGLAQSVEDTERLIGRLERAGLRVMFDLPKPVLPAPAFRCSDWFNRTNPVCANGLTVARSSLETLQRPVLAALAGIADRHPAVLLWDPFPVLCPGETCSALGDMNFPLFYDGDHLSGFGNLVLYPDFRRFLLENPG